MSAEEYFDRAFSSIPVMGIFRSQGLEGTLRLCEAAWNAGVRVVEVPLMTSGDVAVLRAAVAAARERGLEVGAGTVTSLGQLDAAAAAGAAFTVAPGLDRVLVLESIERGLPHLPGIATATELQAALSLGCTWVKVFPAAQLGTAWIQAMRGPFPHVRMVATGGIAPETAGSFLEVGCRAVALGAALEDEAAITRLVRELKRP